MPENRTRREDDNGRNILEASQPAFLSGDTHLQLCLFPMAEAIVIGTCTPISVPFLRLTFALTGLLGTSGVWQSEAVHPAGTWMFTEAKWARPPSTE